MHVWAGKSTNGETSTVLSSLDKKALRPNKKTSLNVIDDFQNNLAPLCFNLLVNELTVFCYLKISAIFPPSLNKINTSTNPGKAKTPPATVVSSKVPTRGGANQSWHQLSWLFGLMENFLRTLEFTQTQWHGNEGGNAMSLLVEVKKHWHFISLSEQKSKVPAFAPVSSLSFLPLLSQQWSWSNRLYIDSTLKTLLSK